MKRLACLRLWVSPNGFAIATLGTDNSCRYYRIESSEPASPGPTAVVHRPNETTASDRGIRAKLSDAAPRPGRSPTGLPPGTQAAAVPPLQAPVPGPRLLARCRCKQHEPTSRASGKHRNRSVRFLGETLPLPFHEASHFISGFSSKLALSGTIRMAQASPPVVNA
jgi:hypothetical protein